GDSTIVKGTGEPGAEIIITDKDGEEVGRGEVGEDGKFEVVVEGGLNDGEEYEVVAEDKAGNQSEPETVVGDQTPPSKPGDLEINNEGDSTIVKGTGEPGAEIIITDKDGEEVGRGEVDEEGNFEIEVEGGLKDGEKYEVVAEDKAGNQSEPETIVGDKTAPNKPEDLEINNNEDGSTTVTGKGESGAEIIITDKDGKEVGRGEVDEEGNFEVVVEGGLEDAKDYEVTAKDPAGNVSDKETITGDTTAPDAPVVDGFT
ncbi:Ig-like domain-containing protein, partial [Thiopseudomonas alkaliphila]|uniref:Ig-like domain-containing protein n=1 Tax=Thiopseudomonas alkaliphila TaxID=1697053 RepID=UPI0025763E06